MPDDEVVPSVLIGRLINVHCKIGYSRSGRATSTDEAAAMLRRIRPSVVIRPEIIPAVAGFIASENP